jgi:hypothetical protein
MLPTQHGTPCAILAAVFWITPLTAPISPHVTYHVFGPLKKTLKGRRFNSDEAVREAVEQWFIQQPMSFFAEGITKLVQRWDKCLNSGGQYL